MIWKKIRDPYFWQDVLDRNHNEREAYLQEVFPATSEEEAKELLEYMSREYFGYPTRETWLAAVNETAARSGRDELEEGLKADLLQHASSRILWGSLNR